MTSKDWKECTLEQISTILGDGLHGTPKYSINGKYAFINGNNLSNGKIIIKSDTKRVDKCEYEKYKKDLNNRTLLVSINGTLGNIAEYNEEKIILGKSACYFNVKEDIDKYFIKYILLSKTFQDYLNNQATGTTIKNISLKQMREYNFLLPPLEIQQKIAKVLSAIDDKIELNNSINNNLEQQAQAIFKENISKNCNNSKNGCIGDYCAIKSGFAFKGSWWQNTGIKVIKIKTIDNDNINFNDCSYVSEDKIQYATDFIVKGGDLLIAMTGATIGKFAIVPKVNETILVNQRVGKFFLGENPVQNLPFLYCTLKEQDVINEIINKGQGSAQPNISGSDIMNTLCYFPEKQNIVDFNNLCTPIFEKIINNKYENYHLIKLRDTLLPKLMSGEIDVSKVEIDDILENQSADKLLFSEDK